jgi:DNA primase
MYEDLADQIAEEHLESVRVKENYISAKCPFHTVRSGTQFWVKRDTGSWGCFSCGAGGGDLKKLLKELGVRAPKVEALIQEAKESGHRTTAREKAKRELRARADFVGVHILPESLLGVYDWCPTSLVEAGYSEKLLKRHGIGFDRKRNRVTFPIRDVNGNLIGISGRTVIGENPKYKVYQGWHVNWEGKRVPGELGEWFSDYSSTDIRNHLWREQFVYKPVYTDKSSQLIVVEGYKAALWLVKHGWENTVALMGSKMTQSQERMIRKMGTETWILLDNNEAGRTGTDFICDRLGDATFPVYRCSYPEDADESAQPDDLSELVLENTLSSAMRATKRRRRHGESW